MIISEQKLLIQSLVTMFKASVLLRISLVNGLENHLPQRAAMLTTASPKPNYKNL